MATTTEAPNVTLETHPDRATWLTARTKSIGASDAAAVLGVSPWATRLKLWAQKRGLDDGPADTPQMRWGRKLEKVIAEAFAEEENLTVIDHGAFTIASVPGQPLSCTLDREVRHPLYGPGVLEVKTAGAQWGGEWPPGELSGLETPIDPELVPHHYWVQVQFQLGVTGAEWGALAVLIGGQDFRWFRVARADQFIDLIFEQCEAFWRDHVEADVEPVAGPGDELATVSRIHPGAEEDTVASLPGEVIEWDAALEDAKLRKKKAESDVDEYKAKIGQAIGEAHVGVCGNGLRFKYTPISTPARVVTPDMVGQTIRKASNYRRLTANRKAVQ